jgi:hypothetical protein
MTRDRILSEYGKDLSKEDIEKIEDLWQDYLYSSDSYIVRSYSREGTPATDGIRAGEEVTPGFPRNGYYN